jgi:histidinol dehydrogenase
MTEPGRTWSSPPTVEGGHAAAALISRLDARGAGFETVIRSLERPVTEVPDEVNATVEAVLRDVQARGDEAVTEYTARWDGFRAASMDALRVSPVELESAERSLGADVIGALRYAAERIERFHAASLPKSWRTIDEHGSTLGQEVRAIERVGLYVPGGRAAYPSTVLMTAIPARVAGVREIVLTTPPDRNGQIEPSVLAAARIGGVSEIYRVGGIQAVGALAYGTATIRAVDKIVGPGNIYVALAKARVFGKVGIDLIAGPSEVVVVADRSARPDWIAADLLAQAEHDPLARAVLVTDAAELLPAVEAALAEQLAVLGRRAIAAQALAAHGALVLVETLDRAVDVANRLAPEHLGLMVEVPAALLPRVRHAGAVFMGAHSSEVLGDYVAGPNHVLPTAGTARFASPLGVDDFLKRSSVVEYSRAGLLDALPHVRVLTALEGLGAHARAAELRAATGTG